MTDNSVDLRTTKNNVNGREVLHSPLSVFNAMDVLRNFMMGLGCSVFAQPRQVPSVPSVGRIPVWSKETLSGVDRWVKDLAAGSKMPWGREGTERKLLSLEGPLDHFCRQCNQNSSVCKLCSLCLAVNRVQNKFLRIFMSLKCKVCSSASSMSFFT